MVGNEEEREREEEREEAVREIWWKAQFPVFRSLFVCDYDESFEWSEAFSVELMIAKKLFSARNRKRPSHSFWLFKNHYE